MAIYVQVGNDVVEFPDGMSDEQIAQAISGSMPQAKAPSSSFMMGLKDPITAGAQMIPRALAGITSLGGTTPNPVSQFFSEEAKRVDEMARAEEQAYQAQREAQGGSGFDVARLGGNILNPASLVPAARVAQLARARGLSTVGQAAAGGAVGGRPLGVRLKVIDKGDSFPVPNLGRGHYTYGAVPGIQRGHGDLSDKANKTRALDCAEWRRGSIFHNDRRQHHLYRDIR